MSMQTISSSRCTRSGTRRRPINPVPPAIKVVMAIPPYGLNRENGAKDRALLHPCAGCLVGYKPWHDGTATNRTSTAGSGFQRAAVNVLDPINNKSDFTSPRGGCDQEVSRCVVIMKPGAEFIQLVPPATKS